MNNQKTGLNESIQNSKLNTATHKGWGFYYLLYVPCGTLRERPPEERF
jgi:hypothetical protein